MSTIEEISDRFCGLALQGPTSRDILQALGVAGIETLPHFGIMETKVDGHWMRIDRAGFTGDLGYELWVKPQDALWLWETLFRLGEPHKIAPIGSPRPRHGAHRGRLHPGRCRLYRRAACHPAEPAPIALSRPASAGPWA